MGNKRDNTGQPYELLVQGIFQAIHDQKEVSNIIGEHNKTLKGKTITHQIDFLLEVRPSWNPARSSRSGERLETPVNQGQLLQFTAVLDDLPNHPRVDRLRRGRSASRCHWRPLGGSQVYGSRYFLGDVRHYSCEPACEGVQ